VGMYDGRAIVQGGLMGDVESSRYGQDTTHT